MKTLDCQKLNCDETYFCIMTVTVELMLSKLLLTVASLSMYAQSRLCLVRKYQERIAVHLKRQQLVCSKVVYVKNWRNGSFM